jgi:hypothetical protein
MLKTPGWLQLANDAFSLIGCAVFRCMEFHGITKVRQNSFHIFVFQSVCLTTTVNTNDPPLIKFTPFFKSLTYEWALNE